MKNEPKSQKKTQRKNRIKKSEKKEKTPKVLFLCLGLGLIALSAAIAFVLPESTVTKVYTDGIFKALRVPFGWFFSVIPFSLTEAAALLLLAGIIVIIIIAIVKLFAKTLKFKQVFSFFCVLVFIAGILTFSFGLCYGLNYHGIDISERFGFINGGYTTNDIYKTCVKLKKRAIELRQEVTTDENGIFKIEDVDELIVKVANETKQSEINPDSRPVYKAKKTSGGNIMSKLGISGIYMPYLFETTINTDMPSLLLPAALAHEYSHSLGIANESEASFAAYVICKNSDDPCIQYSGTMLALLYCSSELKNEDYTLYKQLENGYSQGMLNDLEDYTEYVENNDGFLKSLASFSNDIYIKVNGDERGVKAYSSISSFVIWMER